MARASTRTQTWEAEGYVLTVDESGLRIVVTDYHAKPLHLDWGDLEELGLAGQSDRPTLRSSAKASDGTEREV